MSMSTAATFTLPRASTVASRPFLLRLLALTLLLLLAARAHSAEFLLRASPRGNICFLEGGIEAGDDTALRSLLARGCAQLGLNSGGGSVAVALSMGRIIRASEVPVVVGDHGFCASACVFLYAGGVSRAPYGPIKIHRPYLPRAASTVAETRQTYRRLETEVKTFLREMNVKEDLFDQMMRIAPEDAEVLTLEHMESIGLGLEDPVYLEHIDNKRAQDRGFSKTEWLSRKKHARGLCGDIDGRMTREVHVSRKACWDRVFPEYF